MIDFKNQAIHCDKCAHSEELDIRKTVRQNLEDLQWRSVWAEEAKVWFHYDPDCYKKLLINGDLTS